MKIERTVDPKTGATTDMITLTTEENEAIERAKNIIIERGRSIGFEMSHWEKEHLEFVLLGRLRFDGLESMMKWAVNAEFSKPKKLVTVGYADHAISEFV